MMVKSLPMPGSVSDTVSVCTSGKVKKRVWRKILFGRVYGLAWCEVFRTTNLKETVLARSVSAISFSMLYMSAWRS